jgi:hypothetical protein
MAGETEVLGENLPRRHLLDIVLYGIYLVECFSVHSVCFIKFGMCVHIDEIDTY